MVGTEYFANCEELLGIAEEKVNGREIFEIIFYTIMWYHIIRNMHKYATMQYRII